LSIGNLRASCLGLPSRTEAKRCGCGVHARGGVVIDKSFVLMVLACAAAPLLGAGIYLVTFLF
jgi:hypothetical protein